MKHVICILIILVLVFTSCEGRKTQNQALNESIEHFKKTVNIHVDVFVPKTYTERKVDTTLANGFSVKIKQYTDMGNSVPFSKIKDTINYQTHFRNFKFDVIVEKHGKIIYNQSFNKSKINKLLDFKSNLTNNAALKNFDRLAVLESIQIDDNPTLKNKVAVDIVYGIPNSYRKSIHRLIINEEGKANFLHIK